MACKRQCHCRATNQTLDVGDFKSAIENKEISLNSPIPIRKAGNNRHIGGDALRGLPHRCQCRDGRNEWSGTTASEEVTGSVNPYPFIESYSKNGTSSTDGTSAEGAATSPQSKPLMLASQPARETTSFAFMPMEAKAIALSSHT